MLRIRTNSDICREEDYEERTVISKEILASEEDGSIPNRILRKPSLQEEYAKTQILTSLLWTKSFHLYLYENNLSYLRMINGTGNFIKGNPN